MLAPTPTLNDLPSADLIVARYLELRAWMQQAKDEFSAAMRPYQEELEVLEAGAGELMRRTGQKALSTIHGTAYQSRTISVKNNNPTEFLNWVFANEAREFLTAHVNKEAVKQYMDKSTDGQSPPGLEVTPVIAINFRKA